MPNNMPEFEDQLPELTLLGEDTDQYTKYKLYGTKIEGLYLFDRELYPDDRGSYQEGYRLDPFEKLLDRPITLRQNGNSVNHPYVLRGFHAEPQDKLITPYSGVIFAAIADIRPDSPTFGEYVSFQFDQRDKWKPKKLLFVANGLANSFMTLTEAEYVYHVTSTYKTSEGKRSVRWNDPDINVQWPAEPKLISKADQNNPLLRELFPEKFS
jgi:dTDP-4-dehydrorhamnose 3,5-epimerase